MTTTTAATTPRRLSAVRALGAILGVLVMALPLAPSSAYAKRPDPEIEEAWTEEHLTKLRSWLLSVYRGDEQMATCAIRGFLSFIPPDVFWRAAHIYERNPSINELPEEFGVIGRCRTNVERERQEAKSAAAAGLHYWPATAIEDERVQCSIDSGQHGTGPRDFCPCSVKALQTVFEISEWRAITTRQKPFPPSVKTRVMELTAQCTTPPPPAASASSAQPSKVERVQEKSKHTENCKNISARFVTLCGLTAGRGWSGSCLAGGSRMQDGCVKDAKLTCLAGMGVFIVGFMDEAEGRGIDQARAWAVAEKVNVVINDQVCSR